LRRLSKRETCSTCFKPSESIISTALYEQKGWKNRAIEHDEKSFNLWMDAESDIAEVDDVKGRLAGLKN
jgi:hypothetical protein